MKRVEAVSTVATAIEDWLKAEVVTSGEERNRYLNPAGQTPEKLQDSFDEHRLLLALPYDDDRNWNSSKDQSHQQQRVPHWVDAFENSVGTPRADFFAARASFAPLMTAAGSHRGTSYLLSETPEQYAALRALGIGIDTEKAVAEALAEKVPSVDFSAARISFASLRESYIRTYNQTTVCFQEMGDRLNGKLEEEAVARSVDDLRKSQFSHVKLATDCMIMAAKLRRGDLTAVPFLEPRSITDQSGEVYFPLNAPVDWLKVLGYKG